MTRTVFQDDFDREVERQARENEGITQYAFNRPSTTQIAPATDEEIESLRMCAEDGVFPSMIRDAVYALVARIKAERERREWLEKVEAGYLECCQFANIVTRSDTVLNAMVELNDRAKLAEEIARSIRATTIRECAELLRGMDRDPDVYDDFPINTALDAILALLERKP
jgi:hypothetical protein